jgi:GNAT superfamily N-acetyltransferase
MHPSVRNATPEDATAISELVHKSFRAHVASDWDPIAHDSLLNDTSAEKLAVRIAESAVVLVFEDAGRILGVILLPRPTLVQLCFVAPGHLGKAIGRALWEAARARIEERFPEVKTVELNSSPYAVGAYKALGFYPISEPFLRGGAVATRMAGWLPGRSLPRAPGAA